uniref:rho-related GTP-binding protein RhoF isoform X2 n=1 Tax=Podarcis muralis TaxID=64176 RepID=UPI0010A0160A|nr:rho-related GTP-binding protein RhoF isoform X2 [Podarcis muralis]XP_028565133.1 rho-related GTP-binding protein RhoF isoform X2 [Podarcis muralis]
MLKSISASPVPGLQDHFFYYWNHWKLILIVTQLCVSNRKDVRNSAEGTSWYGRRKIRLLVLLQYAPSVFEKYTTSITLGKKEVLLHLYDTAGQEDYDRLRPLSYQSTNVVLICYDVMNPTSFDNVLIKWSHEVNHFCRGIPIVLVGCKTDLRKDKEHLRKLRSAQQEPITYIQGEEACRRMNADIYLECSAKFRENVEDVFRETANIALNAIKKAKRQTKSRPCAIL